MVFAKRNYLSSKRRFFRGMAIAGIAMALSHGWAPLSARTNLPGVIYWHGDPAEKKVALTFDDGPNEPYTSEVLKVLRDNGVRATFFMMGENVQAYPETARAIVRDGHAIGNHSFSHHNMVLETNGRVRDELLKTEDIIETVTGRRTNLFRPPYGNKDFFTLHESRKLGFVMVEWTISAQDWRRPGVNHIVRRVLGGVQNGSIVLMHDGDKWRHGSDRSQTVDALPILIRELRAKGYEFVTVPELLKLQSGEAS